MKYDRFGSSGHIIPRFFLICKGAKKNSLIKKEYSVAERDDGIPVIVGAAVKHPFMHTRVAGGCLYHASVALGKPINVKSVQVIFSNLHTLFYKLCCYDFLFCDNSKLIKKLL